ncbi:uncharacterized protein LOC141664525 [Apium graveolens]|uniref:uncharacterized protein LOC141664525 n=1 Tax=Apium graveolens TaxID=4045 RepID=UPI003D799CF8
MGFLQLHLSKAPGPSANGAVNTGIDPSDTLCKVVDQYVTSLNPNTSIPQMSHYISNDNVNVTHQFISNDNPIRPTGENGATILLVGELLWWTTDTEIESVASKYGTLKEIKFFDEKANGKSRGYCQVEFYDSVAAALFKEGMNGYIFKGRACTVEFASSDALWKMAVSYMKKKIQFQPQSHEYEPEKRPMNDNAERSGAGRGSIRTVRGSRARRSVMRVTGMPGGRGPGYGDFTGPAIEYRCVSHHVDSCIFGKGMSANRMGMMGSARMEGPHSGMWNDGIRGGEEHYQRPREWSYGGKEGGSEYKYGEGHYKFSESYGASREKDRESERDRSDNSNKRHRDERGHGRDRYVRKRYDRESYQRERCGRERNTRERYHRDRYDREHRYREHNHDWDHGRAFTRYRSRSRFKKVNHRSHSRGAVYGKRSS